MAELLSLVEHNQRFSNEPTINDRAFPATPRAAFWTGAGGTEGHAWVVGFGAGDSFQYLASLQLRVRCVR